MTDAIGCGARGGTPAAAAPRIALTPAGPVVAAVVVPGLTAVGPCRDLQVTPGAFGSGPDPSCLDMGAIVRDALHRQVGWWCRPHGVERDPAGHPLRMSDTPTDPPPTKPLPDLPDEPVPTPMPKDPPMPQPGQPSG